MYAWRILIFGEASWRQMARKSIIQRSRWKIRHDQTNLEKLIGEIKMRVLKGKISLQILSNPSPFSSKFLDHVKDAG
jgi:hypothetical protein